MKKRISNTRTLSIRKNTLTVNWLRIRWTVRSWRMDFNWSHL